MRKSKGMSFQFITNKSLPRRTFLRGAGAMLGLPMLGAMMPQCLGFKRPPRPRGASDLYTVPMALLGISRVSTTGHRKAKAQTSNSPLFSLRSPPIAIAWWW